MADTKISDLAAVTSLLATDELVLARSGASNKLDATYLPGAELAYTEFTSNVSVSATADASANTVVTASAVTGDGSTVMQIEFYSPCIVTTATSAALLVLNLYDGSTDLGRLAILGTEAAASHESPCLVSRRLTPSAASHTYSIRAWASTVAGGGATVQAGLGGTATNLPGFIRITRA